MKKLALPFLTLMLAGIPFSAHAQNTTDGLRTTPEMNDRSATERTPSDYNRMTDRMRSNDRVPPRTNTVEARDGDTENRTTRQRDNDTNRTGNRLERSNTQNGTTGTSNTRSSTTGTGSATGTGSTSGTTTGNTTGSASGSGR